MGSQWLLLLVLLIGNGALNLSGRVTVWGVGSDTVSSTKDSVPLSLRTTVFSSTSNTSSSTSSTSAPAKKRPTDSAAALNTSSVTMKRSTSSFPEGLTSATPPTTPLASRITGSTEQTTQVGGIQEGESKTAIPTPSKSTALSTSMTTSTLKDQEGKSRTTALSSMATSAETPEESQRASTSTPTTSSLGDGMEPSETTDDEKPATTTAPTILNTTNDAEESLSMATIVKPIPVSHTTSLTLTTLGRTILGTTMSESQEGKTADVPLTPATVFSGSDMNSSANTMSTLSETLPNTVSQTPSGSADSAFSAGTAMGQLPKTTAAHPAALSSTFLGTTKSSAMAEASQASPTYTQNSSVGACALDEYPTSRGGCMCNDSYYAHSELSKETVILHCRPQAIEVVLSSCFLKTHHWMLRDSTFSTCPNVSKMEQGRRGQAFMVEKKEGSCGLHLSTNGSHALYFLEVQLLRVPLGSTATDSRMINFSCTYPLTLNVSQTHPQPVVSFPYSTIHMPGTGDTIVILGIFTDPQLWSSLENQTVPLGKPLYMVFRATSSDPDRFALVANEVFASTDISRTNAFKTTYHFVNESCPVSNRLLEGPKGNGASLEVTLTFKLFRFLTSDTLYLHGRVTLCDKQAGHPCKPSCRPKRPSGKNRRREIRAQESLEGGNSWLVFGPIKISESNASSSRSPAGAWMAIFLLMVIGWMLE